MAYSNYGTGIYNNKPSGENILEQAYNPLSNYISGRLDAASLAREAVRQNGMKYTPNPVQPVQTNPLDVFTGPNARLYDAATGRLKHVVAAPTAMPGVRNVNPNTMSMFLQGQSQEAMGGGVSNFADFNSSITNNVPDFFKGDLGIPYSPERMENYPLNGFPYVGGLDNQTTMSLVGQQGLGTVATPTPVQKKFSLSPAVQQQVQQPQQQPVQVRAATADVQPTTSQQISPIGLQSVTGAMNAKSTAGNPIPDATNTDMSLWGKVKQGVGGVFGISPDQQYLKNQNGSLMVDDNGNNIVDPSQTTWGDVGAGLLGTAQLGLGAYGMFTGMDQQQQALDTQRGQLNLMREKYAEDKRKNQAIVAQNWGA